MVYVCVWGGVRGRWNIALVLRHIRGAADEMQPVIQAVEWMSCSPLDI